MFNKREKEFLLNLLENHKDTLRYAIQLYMSFSSYDKVKKIKKVYRLICSIRRKVSEI